VATHYIIAIALPGDDESGRYEGKRGLGRVALLPAMDDHVGVAIVARVPALHSGGLDVPLALRGSEDSEARQTLTKIVERNRDIASLISEGNYRKVKGRK